MVQINIDNTAVKPDLGSAPLPPAWYNVAISKSEVAPNSAGDGARLNFTLDVLDGEFMGRKLFNGLNIQHPKQEVVDRSLAELRAMTDVMGLSPVVKDTVSMHGIPFQVKVTSKPASGEYEAGNNIKGYKDASGLAPGEAPVGGASPGNFGGTAAPEQAAVNPAFGGDPAANPAPAAGGAFDPNTGQPIAVAPQPAFDPNTGQPIAVAPQPAFDPNTGQPIAAATAAEQPAGNGGWQQGAADPASNTAAGGGAPWGAPKA